MPYLLLSSAKNDQAATRTFNEFETLDDLAIKLINYYEDYLHEMRQTGGDQVADPTSYTSEDLFDFIDSFFGELVCLVQNNETNEKEADLWVPHTKDHIKELIYIHLRKQLPSKEGDEEMEVEPRSIFC